MEGKNAMPDIETLKKRAQNCSSMLEALQKSMPERVHRLGQLKTAVIWRLGWHEYKTEQDQKDWLDTIEYTEQFLERLASGENVWR
jgi:hypothetical protein